VNEKVPLQLCRGIDERIRTSGNFDTGERERRIQPSILSNSPSAISICFDDSTRAACFRLRAVAEFREARMQDTRAGKGNREEEGGRDRSIASLHVSTAVETLPRPSLPFPA